MNEIIYVEYPDRVEKFNICKKYGIDPELRIGDKPLPRKINTNDIAYDYPFLLKLLPIELWLQIFEIIYKESLVNYRYLVGTEIEYNLHRLFKKRVHEENYKGFGIRIKLSPTIFQFYSHAYMERDITEYYSYNSTITHKDLHEIKVLSDFIPRFTQSKIITNGPSTENDKWGLCLYSEYERDFVFTEGFNIQKILRKIRKYREDGMIRTFKTVPYHVNTCKKFIDNFFSKENRIRHQYS